MLYFERDITSIMEVTERVVNGLKINKKEKANGMPSLLRGAQGPWLIWAFMA